MAERKHVVHKNMMLQQLLNAVTEQRAADPTGADLVAGRFWWSTADNRARYFDGTAVKTVAWLSDFNSAGSLIPGGWDASGNTLPNPAVDGRDDPSTPGVDTVIKAGDRFIVTVASTTALGLASGDAVLEPGDMLVALADNPAAPTDWAAINVNIDMSNSGSIETVNIASVAPGSAVSVGFVALATVHNVQVTEDATGAQIDMDVRGQGTGSITIETNVALGAVTVHGIGKV